MRKYLFLTIATAVSIFLIVPASYADLSDQMQEGKELVKSSQQLMDKGEMLMAYKDQDKVWLVDQGHQMLKEGMDMIEKGEMMYTDQGRSYVQEIGAEMRTAGNLLLKMGRKKDPLTPKDKEEIVKKGKAMTDLGKLKLDQGKLMAP